MNTNPVSGPLYVFIGLASLFWDGILTRASAQFTDRPLTLSTVAGLAGTAGPANGRGTNARFNQPYHLALDHEGNAFVADYGTHTIRKIDREGNVSTYAGMPGVPGSADGMGSVARFHFPAGIACDHLGVVYIADTGNSTIRKITRNQQVTTVAGTALATGTANGQGSAARFQFPNALAARRDGTLYVADTYNHTIRKITAAGQVTTVAGVGGQFGSGDGLPPMNRLNLPTGIVPDQSVLMADSAILFITDYQNHLIRKLDTTTGSLTTLAGSRSSSSGADGASSTNSFNFPYGITMGNTGMYVSDYGGHTIRWVDKFNGFTTTVVGLAGTPGTAVGAGGTTRLNQPVGVALSEDGALWISEKSNHRILRGYPVAKSSDMIWSNLAGNPPVSGAMNGTGPGALFNAPGGITADESGNVYVADSANKVIRKIDRQRVVTTYAGTFGVGGTTNGNAANALFDNPASVVAARDGTLFIGDLNSTIRRIAPNRIVSTFAGQAGSQGTADGNGAAARFGYILGLALGKDNTLYAADDIYHVIRRITPSGDVTTLAGTASSPGFANATGTAARFNSPAGVAVDSQNNVYVADRLNYVVRKITPEGSVSTLAGLPGTSGRNDGSGPVARFEILRSIAFSPDNLLYVVDSMRVRQITLDGVVTTVGGDGSGVAGIIGGAGSLARFYQLKGITVSPLGAVYVADNFLHRISVGVRRESLIRHTGEGYANLLMIGDPYQKYSLERSAALTGANWLDMGSAVTSPAGALFFTDIDPPPGRGFYRLRPQ